MTRQESFKRRIRARMAKTGEKYGAARRALLDGDAPAAPLGQPETSDDAVVAATGRSWDQWRTLLDAWPGRDDGHGAIVRHLTDEHGLDGWWAQSVTVGYERMSGRRLPHQAQDGTFTVSVSKTLRADPGLATLLRSEDDLPDLFPGLDPVLRSRPASKNVRVGLSEGVAELALDPRDDGRVRIAVQHARLDGPDSVETWRSYWKEWLAALDEAADDGVRA